MGGDKGEDERTRPENFFHEFLRRDTRSLSKNSCWFQRVGYEPKKTTRLVFGTSVEPRNHPQSGINRSASWCVCHFSDRLIETFIAKTL